MTENHLLQEVGAEAMSMTVGRVKDEEWWREFPHLRPKRKRNQRKTLKLCRGSLDQKVEQLMDRVAFVNRNDDFCYRVSKVVLFGSYVAGKQRPGDLDVGIQLTPRWPASGSNSKSETQIKREKERIDLARHNGRNFRNSVELLCWPEQEVWRFLKARQSSLSLHDYFELERIRPVPYRVLLGDEAEVEKQIGGVKFQLVMSRKQGFWTGKHEYITGHPSTNHAKGFLTQLVSDDLWREETDAERPPDDQEMLRRYFQMVEGSYEILPVSNAAYSPH